MILVVVMIVVDLVVPIVVVVTVLVQIAIVIVVLSFNKNSSLWNDALAYHMTMADGVGVGVNVGGDDRCGGWVVGAVMVKAVIML